MIRAIRLARAVEAHRALCCFLLLLHIVCEDMEIYDEDYSTEREGQSDDWSSSECAAACDIGCHCTVLGDMACVRRLNNE